MEWPAPPAEPTTGGNMRLTAVGRAGLAIAGVAALPLIALAGFGGSAAAVQAPVPRSTPVGGVAPESVPTKTAPAKPVPTKTVTVKPRPTPKPTKTVTVKPKPTPTKTVTAKPTPTSTELPELPEGE
ncbi:hypothetical protein ACIQBJ_33835 [Kitasatospora sp. NPDC088391]|uniref:hypothetical protein n=1 Tax=Kitasatospora sp. NPDC088391 TaxID=3364074 RepID=UPI003815ECF1